MATQAAYELNCPVRLCTGGGGLGEQFSLLGLDTPDVIVETVKMAEGGRGALIVRLYEAAGGRVPAALQVMPAASMCLVHLLLLLPCSSSDSSPCSIVAAAAAAAAAAATALPFCSLF